MSDQPLPLWKVIEEEFLTIGGSLCDQYVKDREIALKNVAKPEGVLPGSPDALGAEDAAVLPKLFRLIHEQQERTKIPRAALCMSGGGIRSATFALGVLQGLARRGLLPQFQYMSTVSGGGFIGSWLSAWIWRHERGLPGVVDELSGRSPAKSPEEPEPRAITFLRDYSNYMSPRLGLFSADTWTLLATVFRNLLLNWTVFLPILAAALMIPRLCVWAVNWLGGQYYLSLAAVMAGAACVAVAIALLEENLPSFHSAQPPESKMNQRRFLLRCLLSLYLGALFVTAGWCVFTRVTNVCRGGQFASVVMMSIAVLTSGVSVLIRSRNAPSRKLAQTQPTVWNPRWLLCLAVASAVDGWLLWMLAKQPFADPSWYGGIGYVCLALPWFMLAFLISGMLLRAVVTQFISDEDREWAARAGGWILMAAISWAVISSLVLLVPSALLHLGPAVRTAVASAGGIAGVVTGLLARSAKTPANSQEAAKLGAAGTIRQIALAMAVPVFVLTTLVALSLATDWLLLRFDADPSLVSAPWAPTPPPPAQAQFGLEMTQTNPLAVVWQRENEPKPSAPPPDKHYRVLTEGRLVPLVSWLLSLAAFGAFMSYFVNINKYSLHEAYRFRLVQAYLGASRPHREDKSGSFDPFTGFDPSDNLRLHELQLRTANLEELALQLRSPDAGPMLEFLRARLPTTMKVLGTWNDAGALPAEFSGTLRVDLIHLLRDAQLGNEPCFAGIAGKTTVPGAGQFCNNLAILRHALPGHFPPATPFHVVNIALNLVHGKKLAWQQRKAESFSATPLHCGSARLGYRASESYGGAKNSFGTAKGSNHSISLGTSVAISGAAASPNMGYHSSPALGFLMTLLNVRSGVWLGNPGQAGDTTFGHSFPSPSIKPLAQEAFGLTDDDSSYVYLSDGGHFDNLGLYEMVRRRCHFIVVSDAGQDFPFAFEDLGNAIRKIYIDLGIRITFDPDITMYPRSADKQRIGRYCALATIHYEEVDKDSQWQAKPGKLLYIKPAFYGNEPTDIYNYGTTSLQFPHETTADQFFTESQFESYRALGEFILGKIFSSKEDGGLPGSVEMNELFSVAGEYLAGPVPDQKHALLPKLHRPSRNYYPRPPASGTVNGPGNE